VARKARVVIPGTPHHVTRRGNRRQQTFFDESDDRACLQLAAEEFRATEVEVRATGQDRQPGAHPPPGQLTLPGARPSRLHASPISASLPRG
jgi:hypothetical protein